MTVSREDIEAKARQLVDAVDETKESVRNKAVLTAAAVGVVVVGAFIIGRRRGSRNKTMVEVYRV
ncbi:MAG TPA: hypothetical protein VMP13_05810 [Acidimicrobiia bacterium]|nr:hypothetical protein [Acidimicrobiia bacterium]